MASKTQICRLSYCSIHLGGTSRQRSELNGRTLVFTEMRFSIPPDFKTGWAAIALLYMNRHWINTLLQYPKYDVSTYNY